jgi:hypothetical protein
VRGMRLWASIPLLLGGLLAGCSGAASSQSAVLTGVASPCEGLPTPGYAFGQVPVHITVKEGSRTFAGEVVTRRHTYRLVAPPGNYVVYSDQIRPPLSVPAVLHSVTSTHVVYDDHHICLRLLF